MPQKVYSDEEVFGAQGGRVYSDEEVFGAPDATTKGDRPGFVAEVARNVIPWLGEGVNTIAGAPFQLVAPEGSAAEFFKNNAEWWRGTQSDDLQRRLAQANQRIDAAGRDGVLSQIGSAAGEYYDDPALAARLAVTNLPSMIPGLGLGKLAQVGGAAAKFGGAAQAALGLGVAGGTNAVLNAGGARGDAFDDIKRSAMARGLSEQDATELALEGSVLPAAVGGVTGFIGGRTGVEKALLGQAGIGHALRRGAGAAGAELIGEQVEEVAPKLTTNFAARAVDPGRTMGQDVGRTIVETAAGTGPSASLAGTGTAYRSFAAGKEDAPPADTAPVAADTVLDRVEPSEAEKALTASGSNTALDRVAEIDKHLLAAPDAPDAEPLRKEREALTAAWPKMVMGGEDSVRTDSGVDLGYRWALVPVDEEVRSHSELGSPNPAYPQELQPRDRARSGSLDQTARMRQQYDPRRAGASPDVQNGAPIMSADGVILSGNARSNVQEQILRANGQKAADLRNYWIETAGAYGFTPEQMRAAFDANPRLALRRVLTTPVNRAEFARQANASTVAVMSPLEQARSDAARIDDMEDLRPDENGDFAASRDFIRRFVGRVPATEQAGMIDADGALSAAGYARVRNAVLAKAYGDSPVLTRMVESMDDNLRNVSRALLIAAPRVAQSRQAIAQGRRFDADLTPHLVGAVEELGRIKDAGGSVADALAQAGLMGDERTPEARELLAFLAENARRPRRMAEFITAYFDALDAAGDPNQGSLLGEVQAPTTGQLMAAAQGESNAKSTSEDAGRGLAGEGGGAGQGAPVGPEAAPGRRGSTQGDAANEQDVAEWQAFAPETGTLGVPRAQMPQVKVARRGELLSFLEGRGIGHARLELPADSLKPTQAEYSPAKTDSAAHMVDEQTDRAAVLVSSDGYVLDGHHRWLARAEAHQPVWAIQFDAPIGRLLDAVMQFPGTHVSKDSDGAVTPSARDAAVADFRAAAADLGDFLAKYARAAFVPENSPEAHKVLVRLFDAAIRIVGTDLKRGIAWVKNYLRAHKDEIAGWNKITPFAYRKAAEEALAGLEERGQQLGLFNDKELAQPDLFGAPERAPVAEAKAAQPEVDAVSAAQPSAEAPVATIENGDHVVWRRNGKDTRAVVVRAPDRQGFVQVRVLAGPRAIVGKTIAQHVGNLRKVDAVAMIDGRPYDIERDNFKPEPIEAFAPPELVARVRAAVKRFFAAKPERPVSAEDAARATALLAPAIEKATAAKAEFDQQIIDIARRTGALGQMLAGIKQLDRAIPKLVYEETFNIAGIKDLLRSTIVVPTYADAQKVIDAIEERFTVLRVKNLTDAPVESPHIVSVKALPESGYRNVLINVSMPNGTVAEIQINTPAMLSAKAREGHALYEVERDLPEGDATRVAVEAMERELYGAAADADAKRSATQAGGPDVKSPPLGSASRGSSASASPGMSPENLKTRPSGKRTQSSPLDDTTNLQPAGNLSGTLIDSTSQILPEKAGKPYTSDEGGRRDDAPDEHDRSGDARARAQDVRGVEGGGQVDGAHPRDGAGHQQRSGDRDDGGEASRGVGQAEVAVREDGRQHERGAGKRAGNRARRSPAVPAGRDLKPKSGLNYRFTDDDVSPPGSWAKRATWNVEAVELIRKLEAEKRQATPDEQRILARFVGWGASEIANNLFGKKLDAQAKALRDYAEAIENLGDKPFLENNNYRMYEPAFAVLQAKTPELNWYTAGRITKAMLDAARPPASVARWIELRDRLKAALTADEWAEAQRSTQYGHYTSAPIVRGMWQAMERFGFKGGLVFEPGAGKGNFPGLMPDALAANSAYTGIEYDSITGAILKQLLPDELVRVESFIDTRLPRDFFDVAIGNPPFAGLSVLADPEYKKHAFKLHDYFFAKTVDRVRPGGLLMFVTSRFTMDKQGDKARKYLAERADLVGAIRLPQTAFKENAGTEVVTDVLFLRKKVPGAEFAQGQAWLKSVPVDVGGTPEMLNEYFAAHPEMVLGTHSRAGSMYKADEYTVLPAEGDIADAFRAAVERMPADIFDAPAGSAAQAAQVREIDFSPTAKKEGNYYVSAKGVLMQRENGVGQAVIPPKGSEAVIRSFIPLRDALKQAQRDQLDGGDWEASLATLRAEYEKFVAAHGRINQFTMRARNVKVDVLDESGQPTGETTTAVEERPVFTLHPFLRDDPEWTLVSALENVNEDTGEISEADALSKRVLIAAAPRRIETAHDALLASLADTGRVDIPEIADSLGLSDAEAIEALGSAIYRNPEGGAWEMADAYLSGNVRRKLEHAEAAAKNDRTYERNIAALKAALPAPKGPASVDIALGMNWIAGDVYSRFLKETAGLNANVAWNDATRQWSVEMLDKGVGGANAGARFDRAKVEWGTADRHAGDLLEHALTGRPIVIERKIDVPGGGKSTVRDLAAMEAANVKLAALKKRFSEWVWEDAARADSLLRAYNERFNAVAPRAFDGRHLTLPGTSSLFNVFDHVKRGAWRIIQSGNTYLAHAVGSGKTFEMVISAMEQKRLGLVKKPMMVVPNHMLRQFSSEWLQLYPAARLMVADEHSFHKDKRRQFVSRVALSDLDGVIITHDAFKMLDIDPDFRAKIIDEQLDALRAALENADEEGDKGGRKSPRVKQIEKRIETLEQKLAAAQKADKKDQNARFDELGVDMLYVDEAHLFRKLDFGTARQVKGISSEGSDRALDLYIKARYLDEKRPGRSLVLASGTPITNTLAELYSVMRFLGRTELAEDGMEDFDSWAAQYGRDVTALEANAAGKYEPVTRFAKFVNVPALIQRFKQFADVLTSDNLAALLGDKRPKVMGGARQIIVTPKTTRFRLNQRDLAARFEASRKWKPSKDEPNNPDPIIRIIGDGRLASIDMRFVNPSAPNDPSSKLNRMIDDVIATYKETAGYTYTDKKTGAEEPHKGATMMVFSDLGFGAGVAANRGFDARAWMEKRLREAGIPSKHLAFMSDHKTNDAKKKLFDGMNSGRIRILVGSSKNMGTGVNAQQRLLDLFHLDTPWFPADLEQREGRIVRQGNKNKEVRIRAYATKGSYDEAMWSMLARKAHFIAQAMEGDPNIDEIEDLDSQSQYDLAAAMTADDPRVLQLAGINAEIGKLERLYKAHEDQRMRFLDRYRSADAEITNSARLLAAVEGVAGKAKDLSGDKFTAEANDRRYSERKEWGAAIKDAARHNASGVERSRKIGDVSGFAVTFRSRRTESAYEWWVTLDTPSPAVLIENGAEDPVQIAMRAQNAVASVARMPQTLRENIRNKTDERDVAEVKAQAAFPMAEMLAGKRREAADLLREIATASVDRPWIVTRLDTGESWTVQAHNEDAAIDAGMAQQGGEPEFWRAIEADQVREFDAEESAAGAAMGMIPPVPMLSRGVGGGIPLPALQAVADRVISKLPGLQGRVHVLASPADAPPKLRAFIEQRGAMGDVEGAFHEGEIYLFASGIADETRAEHVLAEHEVAHAGLAAILGDGRKQAMQAIWNNNAEIRRVTKPMIERGLSLAEAVEEAIVDLPSGRLARLKGWRVLVGKMRDALGRLGFDRLAAQIDGWLGGHLSEQQRADLAVADLVRAARRFVGQRRVADTRLSRAGDSTVVAIPGKGLIKGKFIVEVDGERAPGGPWDNEAAAVAAGEAWKLRKIAQAKDIADERQRWDRIADRIRGGEAPTDDEIRRLGLRLPASDVRWFFPIAAELFGLPSRAIRPTVANLIRVGHTDMGAAHELVPTRAALMAVAGADTRLSTAATAAPTVIADRYDAPLAAPAGGIGENTPLFSRAATPAPPVPPAAAAPQQDPVEQRAEKIIQTSASTPKPLDALTRMLTRATGLERLGVFGYGLGAKVLDWITPETVKAGIVADYGVPQAVIDQRAMLQGRQREQLREAGHLLEKLATMTRAESRVAYEWMNGEDTRTADELMKELPAESVAVLREVRLLIDKLSREAVRLGQLDPEAFKRHRFAYLRRSYFKHEADLTSGEKKARASAIAILGDQYKGRGIVLSAKMKQIQNIAPDWWGRKFVAGKADTSLKGEKFERLERRAPSGDGTASLEGVDGEKRPGKLLEIHYWPVGEPKPAKYADWDSAGVFEAINTKGGEVTLWRDFTKAERQKMGEIDEARYAIAKTMQRMIHDVEVGRYLEWLAQNHGRREGEPFAGTIVDASERYRDTFKPGEWVRVPDTKISGTNVTKFGKLAGMYLPGPIWNDVRQVAGGAYRPWGETYHHILRAWKASKTALSPAVHMNNVMSNFVMADWHDVSSGHVAKALRIVLAAGDGNGRGALGRLGNAVGLLGVADRDAARKIIARYENSGGAIGGWVTQEIASEQLAPIVDALQRELGAKAGPSDIGVYAALQHMLHARLPQAWLAFKGSRPANIVATDAKNLIDLYQAEDDVFRLAAWLKAKEGGASDADAGKAARRSFLDYSINAPWVQMMRHTALPFISFTYRAVPMLIETAARRPHKIMKLMMVLGALNMLGSMLAGGDDDDEARKLLPDEKSGRIWGIVPKLIRMPWNDAHDSPVFLDIRRWVPVGDVFDLGQGHAALPVPPALMPGGPLAVLGEVVFNRSMFTGQPIALDTDTATEHASKLANHLWKAATPNIIGLPGAYATTGVLDAAHGRTDAFGRERSVAQSLLSGIGIKLGSYPPDLLRRNLTGKAKAEIGEIEDEIYRLKRQRATNVIEQDEFEDKVRAQQEKIRGIAERLRERVN